MPISRRTVLRAAATIPAWSALHGLEALTRSAYASARPDRTAGYGVLRAVPSVNTGETALALPEGFRYTLFGRTGERMSDGLATPAAHDGMAAFDAGGELRLVRNHEVRADPTPGRAIAPAAPTYDPLAGGGTTTLVVDPDTRLPVRTFASLSGTLVNCAGGPTPWGSWISCEETTTGTGAGYAFPHGYCFEVPAAADGPVDAVPLRAMGRFVHEAIAVDPDTGIVYLTEDRSASGLYRFVPRERGRLARGGRLEMLAIRDHAHYDTRTGQTPLADLPVAWVPIEEPDPDNAESNAEAVQLQGRARGGATFARLEGAWYGGGRIYVAATSGGDSRLGQIWEYRPGREGGTLRLIYESRDTAALVAPDNLCVSPRGTGLVLCEDGPNVQHLRGLTIDGQIFDFAQNVLPGFEESEFAGATFSPDGRTLFVNIQRPGVTLAIWGDWARGPL